MVKHASCSGDEFAYRRGRSLFMLRSDRGKGYNRPSSGARCASNQRHDDLQNQLYEPLSKGREWDTNLRRRAEAAGSAHARHPRVRVIVECRDDPQSKPLKSAVTAGGDGMTSCRFQNGARPRELARKHQPRIDEPACVQVSNFE